MSAQERERVVVSATHQRLGVVLSSDGSDREAEGILNPAIARDRNGVLLMYPRMVAAGNVSRIGIARGHEQGDIVAFERLGIVLEAEYDYEGRSLKRAHGCEDARVTFIPRLDAYVMTYTAFSQRGTRIALAVSDDAHTWTRLGLLTFADEALNRRDNKDAAFFPEPVISPAGVLSFAVYHRPMLPSTVNGQTPIPVILALDPEDRECTCIAYVPAEPAIKDITQLRFAAESVKVLGVDQHWGWLKNGAGTPPVQTEAGWVSVFHAVDPTGSNGRQSLLYRAGLVVHDLLRPDRMLYRSPSPLLGPVTPDERFGIVDDVVFPTGIDVRGDDVYDVYYGAADAKIARARFRLRFH